MSPTKITLYLPFAVASLLLLLASQAPAVEPVNNWTNPVSAHWQDPYWSLRILPGPGQTVTITNDGFKAVNIDASTLAAASSSLTVSNLTILAPADALSTLLLNYTGLNAPFTVLGSCTIGTNGTLFNAFSRFELGGSAGEELRIAGGSFIQQGGLTVVQAPVNVLSGSLNATNADLTLGALTLGSYTNAAMSGYVNQEGGSLLASNVVIAGGAYTLAEGTLYALQGTFLAASPSAVFYQAGGTNYGSISTDIDSRYYLQNGLIHGNTFSSGFLSWYQQDNGLLEMQFINVAGGTNYPGEAQFLLNNGNIRVGTLNIGDNGVFQQQGGDCYLTNNLDVQGMFFMTSHGPIITHADLQLLGGTFHAPALKIGSYGTVRQYGGTNDIPGALSAIGGVYLLQDGTLRTASTALSGTATFTQNLGQHFVNGSLSISNLSTYDMLGGTLVVNGLNLYGELSVQSYFASANFTNTGIIDFAGRLDVKGVNGSAGQVRLSGDSIVMFLGGPTEVHFRSSAGLTWAPDRLLSIMNWDNTTNGAGFTRVFFGTDATSLTASQLAQIRFINPGGFPSGGYPATLLSTGEVVPVSAPTLQFTRSGNSLVLIWPYNYELLRATNINGPFVPVANTVSPYTNSFSLPQEFFMLQLR